MNIAPFVVAVNHFITTAADFNKRENEIKTTPAIVSPFH